MRNAAWLVFALAAPALAAPRDEPAPAELDDPCLDAACTHHALDAWRSALAAARAGTADHPLRVSVFGDSLIADDHLTDALRGKLQALVGDGGAGFVFAAPPHPYCEARAVVRVVSEGWTVHGISTVVPPDHLLGLGGSAESEDGTIRLAPRGAVRTIDIHYLAQPHGGALEVIADGKPVQRIATAADHKLGAFARVELPDGARHLELRARGRVRLFGETLEASAGAVVDNLGVVNATAKAMRTSNLDDHLRNQLAHRAPDLIVVMYGANEAEWLRPSGAGMAEHEKLFGELLATMRAARPEASCLVVSPLDQTDWRDDKLPPRDSVPAMVAAQHRAASANGCAFWDTYAWMGGKGSSRTWQRRGLMIKDYQHPTSEGAERIAAALYAGLVH
ncbi:MAG TPA: GDSL-type esterase/lipase family protein [Kofleriaceae bacterium]|nr:GDSL-type esterase/lipase family protein [Kofleriaceae bacterium]